MPSDRWAPSYGARVRCIPLRDEGGVAPPGRWICMSKAPRPRSWWLQAADNTARDYAVRNGQSGCIERSSLGFEPRTHTRI